MNSYKDLIIYQKSIQLCIDLYKVTEGFPKSEIYGITNQIRRNGVSIPSNIAEGQRRGYKTEYVQFLRIAFGSGAELETQLLIAFRVGILSKPEFDKLNSLLNEVMKMLNKLISSLTVLTK